MSISSTMAGMNLGRRKTLTMSGLWPAATSAVRDGVGLFAEDVRYRRVDRVDLVTVLLHVEGDVVAGLGGDFRETDDGDGAWVLFRGRAEHVVSGFGFVHFFSWIFSGIFTWIFSGIFSWNILLETSLENADEVRLLRYSKFYLCHAPRRRRRTTSSPRW